MAAVIYIVGTLMWLYLLVLQLRLLLQWSRADFRNQIARGIVQLTNPVILPLRRVLPPIGKLDTASLVALVVGMVARVAVLSLLAGHGLPAALPWLQESAITLVRLVLYTYFFAILLYALLSLVAPGTTSPAQSLLASLCEPVLRVFRRFIPPISGFDLSPLWAGIAIQALLLLIPVA